MAITTDYKLIQEKFNPRYYTSIEEFEKFYLEYLSETLADTNYYTNKEGEQLIISPVNHFPVLKEYEVWVEGYEATGGHQEASIIGKVQARNFAQACHLVMSKHKIDQILEENNPEYKKYTNSQRWDYDPHNLSIWGCKLFWNKEIASKTFN